MHTDQSDASENGVAKGNIALVAAKFLGRRLDRVGFCGQQQAHKCKVDEKQGGTDPMQPATILDPSKLNPADVHGDKGHAQGKYAGEPSRAFVPFIKAAAGDHEEADDPEAVSKPCAHAGEILGADGAFQLMAAHGLYSASFFGKTF